MTTRRSRATGSALVALTLLAAPAVAAAQSEPPQQGSVGSVRASITDVSQVLSRDPTSAFRLRATFVNESPAPQARVRWRLRIAPPVTTRVGLTAPFDERGESTVLWHDDTDVIDVLGPGERRDVLLYLRLDELADFPAPDEPAVFPVRFEVTHRIANTLATADTFLIWNPAPQPTLRIGWLVPITEPPARVLADDGSVAIRGDSLEQSVSPGGRLDSVLTALDRGDRIAGSPVPVTLAVDAETVESVTALAAGSSRVAADGSGPRSQRIGSPAAATWLSRLKRRAALHPVIALPYADADIVALVRADLSAEMTAALQQGRTRLDALLGITSRTDIAWPVGEVADAATTNQLADNAVSAVILDRLAVRGAGGAGAGTSTAASDLDAVGRRITAIVPDAPITSLARDVLSSGTGFILARHRLLAETAVIQQQRPGVL
ncbi:MAG: DUF6049 family protein, partial [Mycobacteriales bacterium]